MDGFLIGENIQIIVQPSEYMDKLSANCMISISGVVNVQGTKQWWSQNYDFDMLLPELDIIVSIRKQENNSLKKMVKILIFK